MTMSSSTVDHVDQVIGSAVTPGEALTAVRVVYIDKMAGATATHIDIDEILRMLRATAEPDKAARARLGRQLFERTGWQEFQPPEDADLEAREREGYSQLAAEYEAEDAERRQIARRRPPASADED
jgi:hypothetical protein